ncbi:MAG: tyrosine-type recombinase/integrase [Granulosicoccus sp.]
MAGIRRLSDAAIRQAKPSEGGKPRKLSDGHGLFLIVTPTRKSWRYDYQYQGKRRSMGIGSYPAVSLTKARQVHAKAREDLRAEGVDPVQARQKRALEESRREHNALQDIAQEWIGRQTNWKESHRSKVALRLTNDVYPVIGARPIAEITPPEVLDCLRRVEGRGAVDSAHRIKQSLGAVFRYAIATGRCTYDPTLSLRGALTTAEKRSYPHITDPVRLGEVLRAIDDYAGSFITRCALQVLPLVFVRPGELRAAEWSEFDLKRNVWTIPASRMKRSQNGNHIVPLSTQAIEALQRLHEVTGHGQLLFPGLRSTDRPISDNTLNAALRRLDVDQSEHVAHGFRHTASTLLNEARGFDPDLIEVQLHHADRTMRGKYNKARYFDERRAMMQSWADYLSSLKNGADVVALNAVSA